MSTTPAHLIGAERITYRLAADKARTAYRRKHGAAVEMPREDRRKWNAAHGARLALAADRAGMNAVRKAHRTRVDQLATMSDPTRVGGAVSGEFLAIITADAEHAAARLEVLAPATTRKAPARKPAAKLAAVPTPTEESPTVDTRTTPATVPAPMPPMSRAARKATRRELAATLRAAGIRPEGDAWREACAAAGLPVRESVPA